MAAIQYYALTQFDTTINAPFAIARYNNGVFERYRNGEWVKDDSLSAIFVGEFNDYETISESEALRIINRRGVRYAQ
ncbi:hypothetical protein [Sporomusa sphaeroides]|uniref:hypothetical protein n=1 Tax=Sporomusa sphaeroides TaxID=47679 RepID=UPI002BF06A0F|nr:hypothetical protein [Sporomusa sphaeroides]HML33846.1 hypothetical protein [Sporomusa sphaeroides]